VKLFVTFDTPLVTDNLNLANWSIVFGGKAYTATVAAAAGALVTLTVAMGAGAPGPDRVTYTPPPFDVRTAAGGFAPAFLDYPIT